MLIRFGCSNYRSIFEYQEILFTASTLKDTQSDLFIPNGDFNKPLLTSIALYGANASGKTNILLAVAELISFVIRSHREGEVSGINRKTFKFIENSDQVESIFDIDFLHKDVHYHYGYKINDEFVLEEWLYSYSYNKRESRKILFHRNKNEDEEFYFGNSLKGKNKIISQLTRHNSLFLSTAAQHNHELLREIYTSFRWNYWFRFEQNLHSQEIAEELYEFKYIDQTIDFLYQIETGIKKIAIKEEKIDDFNRVVLNERNSFSLELYHEDKNGKLIKFDLEEESLGTKAIIALLRPIFEVINNGGVLVVDEIESSLHPLLTLEVIRLFSKSTTNPLGAQIFFSTHETNILCSDVLRRDQIWFSEKTANRNTIVTPLTDFSLRKNYNIESGYLEGRFGAIPFLGDIKKLFQRATSNNG